MAAKTYGLLAEYATTADIYHAAETVRDAGYRKWDVYTPFPVHGMDGAMGLKRSKVPVFTFLGGLTGFCTGLFIVWYMNAFEYPLVVGGKPFFSPIFPFPVFYELTILCAAFGTLGGMFLLNLLPRHHHPVFNHPEWAKFMDDKFALVIETRDPLFDPAATRALLESTGAKVVELPDA